MSGFNERVAQRQKAFKKGVDADDARRKREDAAVQLRKQTRDEALAKKRMVNDPAPGAELATPSLDLSRPSENGQMELSGAMNGMSGNMVPPHLSSQLMSNDPQAQFSATQEYRKLLSIEQNPPIQEVIMAGVVPRFVQFLQDTARPELQFEAAWVLTNIASGTAEQTRVVVEQGALPIFVMLLRSPSDDVREQAVWALGNIAGDSPNFRDLVLQSGGLDSIIAVLNSSEKMSMTRNATWALSNLCRGKPPPPLDWITNAFGMLSMLIHTGDVEVLTDACWALSYLSDGPNERIAAVLQSGVTRRVVELLEHTSPLVQTPALRMIGNIATGDDTQTQCVLDSGALPSLLKLLSHTKKAIRKETCWTISNITAGNREQIQAVIDNGLIPPVVNLLAHADFDIKKEAAWVVGNATSGGHPAQVEYLVQAGVIPPIVELMGVGADAKSVNVCLDAIDNILRVGKNRQMESALAENPFAAIVEQADGLTKMEALQEDASQEVYQKAVKILETYFPIEDLYPDNIADDAAAGQNFQFGAQVPQGGFNFGAPTGGYGGAGQ